MEIIERNHNLSEKKTKGQIRINDILNIIIFIYLNQY